MPAKSTHARRKRARARDDRQLRILVGTRKGAFIFTGDESRRSWKFDGPHFAGQSVYHLVGDDRPGANGAQGVGRNGSKDSGCLFAAVSSPWFGSNVHRSADGGRTWNASREGLRYAEDSGMSVKCVWHVRPGRPSEPGVVYAGVDPAGLFKSEDGGESWSEVLGLNRHPTRDRWNPGAGGLIVHTILLDPLNEQRMYVGISAAGVFRSDDGGNSWQPRNRNTRADFLPEKMPELGQCVHKVVMAPGQSSTLYQQNHCGIYRSENMGDDWKDISRGVPSRFGFPIVAHPRDPETIWVIPMKGAEMRACPGGEMAVYRSVDAGRRWSKQGRGLPSRRAYLLVLRDAFAVDGCDPAGLYFGTATGQLFHSADEGRNWKLLADFLPPILSVETAVA